VKFLVDMPISPDLAGWLRGEDHDALHASDLSLQRSPDETILAVAKDQNRVVITADLDFPRLVATIGADGPGLILLRGGNYTDAESVECVRRVLMSIDQDDLPKSIIVVDRDRVRRRWLPI
jgi:predicted nuclease of predicted toxin-antitoxin system